MTSVTYKVTGMTCDHCVRAVTEELASLEGVGEVSVELVPDGVSSLTVTSERPLSGVALSAALDEAGDYRLVG